MKSLTRRAGSILTLCLVCTVPSIATSEPDTSSPETWDLPQLMARMAEVSNTRDRFTETKSLAVLTEPLILSGNLFYKRPDRVEKHVLSPYEEHLIVEGDNLTLIDQDGKKRIALHKYPVIRAFVESIRGALAGDMSTLTRFYQVVLTGDRRRWTLTLKPLDQQLADYVRFIRLSGTDNRVTQIDMQEAGGDSSVMTIRRNGP